MVNQLCSVTIRQSSKPAQQGGGTGRRINEQKTGKGTATESKKGCKVKRRRFELYFISINVCILVFREKSVQRSQTYDTAVGNEISSSGWGINPSALSPHSLPPINSHPDQNTESLTQYRRLIFFRY